MRIRLHERYVFAIAKQMQKEYELIHAKGFFLQLDFRIWRWNAPCSFRMPL